MSGTLAVALERAPHTIRASREHNQRGRPAFYDIVGQGSTADDAAEPEGRNRRTSTLGDGGDSRGTSPAAPARAVRATAGAVPGSAAFQQSLAPAGSPRNLSVSLQGSVTETHRR